MTYLEPKKPDYLFKGEMARLFPAVATTSAEHRATSVFLSSLMAVKEFRVNLLKSVGAKCHSRSKVECFTEIEFFRQYYCAPKGNSDKPDGLIVVTTGKNIWRALVEVKIGNNKQRPKQIEDYRKIATECKIKIDAIITISNQFVSQPNLQPNSISDIKSTAKVKLFHWSWSYLLNEASICLKKHDDEKRNISDKDQEYILREFARFCVDKRSGVNHQYGTMGENWANLCKHLQTPSGKCKKSEISKAVSSWQKLTRSLALQLGMYLGETVDVKLSKKHQNNPKQRLQDSINSILSDGFLTEELAIPNTSSPLTIIVYPASKTVVFSMSVNADQSKKKPETVLKSFLKMIKTKDDTLVIEALMPKKKDNCEAIISKIKQTDGHALLKGKNNIPKKFKATKIVKFTKSFNSRGDAFSNAIFKELQKYYDDIGKFLKNPPNIKNTPKSEITLTQDNTADDSENDDVVVAN